MLNVHILNVNHGDSIVIEFKAENKENAVYGVIDSNKIGKSPPPALLKLKNLGAKEISFIALTHPDCDHYMGLSQIFEEYQYNIDSFYTFPIGKYIDGRLRKFSEIYKEIYATTDSTQLKLKIIELIRILNSAKKYVGLENWEEPNGYYNKITPSGFEGVEIAIILPPPSVKGEFFELIKNGSYDVLKAQKTNPLSLAFCLSYKGNTIILCGDADKKSWLERERRYSKKGGGALNAVVAKLPHHGSDKDCTQDVFNHIYLNIPEIERVAIVSANGQTHPDLKTLQTLKNGTIGPYCTNLSKHCGNKVIDFTPLPGIAPDLARYIRMLQIPTNRTVQPCQGDITISFNDDGKITVDRQYNHPCIFRNEYEKLFGLA